MLNVHLVFYIMLPHRKLSNEMQVLLWRDSRLSYETVGNNVRYFVLQKKASFLELRESEGGCLDFLLNCKQYFFVQPQSEVCRQTPPESLEEVLAKVCGLPVVPESTTTTTYKLFELAGQSEQLYRLWKKKILVFSYKGLKIKNPGVKTNVKHLFKPAKNLFQLVCVIAEPAQMRSLRQLNIDTFDYLVCAYAENVFCLLAPSFKSELKKTLQKANNEDVTRDRVETLEVGEGGANFFAQSKKEEAQKKEQFVRERKKKYKCDDIPKYCRCESCHVATDYDCNMSRGGPEKLITHKLTLSDYVKILGALTPEFEEILNDLSRLSVAAFDIESMTVKLSHLPPGGRGLPYAEIDSASLALHSLALQKPVMLSHRDALLPVSEPCPLFTLKSNEESDVYKLLRDYWKYVRQRHKAVSLAKKQLAQPLLDLVRDYESAYLEYAKNWRDPTDSNKSLTYEETISGWRNSLPGQLYARAQTLIAKYDIFSFYGSGYDHVLLESYLVPYLFEKGLRPKLEKRGNKITTIKIPKLGVAFRDVVGLLAPGTSLKQFGQLFSLRQEKASFPFGILTGVEALELPELPNDLSAWKSELSSSKGPVTRADIEEARRLFVASECCNVGDYLATYLRLDVDILYKAVQAWRCNIRQEVGLDFVETGNYTISSVSNLAGERCASRHLQFGQYFPNSSPVYRLLRKGMRGYVQKC